MKKEYQIAVPYIDQSVRYPTGCESVSTVMLLQYLGMDISVDEFIERYLKRRDMQVCDGQMHGPDPREYFCGSPYDEDSFGCYAPVILDALEKVFETGFGKENDGSNKNRGVQKPLYEAVDETGTPTGELLRQYIDNDMPVIYWACINMREPVTGPEWKLFDSGNTFTWISNEHCMLLVGYDEEGYYFNDPHENRGVIRYPKDIVEARHAAQYSMAVGVRKVTV